MENSNELSFLKGVSYIHTGQLENACKCVQEISGEERFQILSNLAMNAMEVRIQFILNQFAR